ncbi:MAG: AAA family ATPase, partial [Candidatus Zixiibacteriota bacterium]
MSTDKTPGTDGDGFRVIRLAASNVKRLRAVDITPDPNSPLVIIGGNNGEGKSSAIDSILYALGGKDAVCADPIRHGQTKASAEVDLGAYIAKRRFSPAGQTLELKTKEGLNVPSPQTVLDNLRGVLNFDPLAFSRMNAKARFDTLRELVHLDIDLPALETKRKALYDSRTELSRRHRDFEGELRQTPEPDAELPSEKVDVGALVAQKSALADQRQENERLR